jgi:uncharacterized membrane protein YeaQ/YmgE (transglycosylase-associated protein family)
MEIIVWIVTGAVVGWFAYAFVGLNEDRGRVVSIVMGVVGAIVGGKVLAPMFAAAPIDPIGLTSFFFTAGAAAAVLFAGNVVQNRWNV